MTLGYPDPAKYPGIVKIVSTWADGSQTVGSGAFVGPNDILTAAHVVDSNKMLIDVDIYAGYDNGPGAYSYTEGGTSIDFYQLDVTDGRLNDSESAWDLALIGIEQNLGNQTGWFGMQAGAQPSINNHQVGYPSEFGYDNLVESYPFEGSIPSLSKAGNFNVDAYDVGRGMSGGPMIDVNGRIVGVFSTVNEAGGGVGHTNRIDGEWDDLMAWIKGNDGIVKTGVDLSTFVVARSPTELAHRYFDFAGSFAESISDTRHASGFDSAVSDSISNQRHGEVDLSPEPVSEVAVLAMNHHLLHEIGMF